MRYTKKINSKKKKVLLAGDTTWPMYVNAFYEALKSIDTIETLLFDFGKLNSVNARSSLILHVQYKYIYGPEIYALNRRLINKAVSEDIDCVFLYSARIILWETVKKLSERKIKIAIYCNDDPFSDFYPAYFWRHLIKSIKFGDIIYSYRECDIEKYRSAGGKDIRLLRSYYLESRNYKIDHPAFHVPKVLFLGHWENDEREDYLNALLDEKIEIGLQNSEKWIQFAKDRSNVVLINNYIDNYNELLNACEIAIVFLSKINNDSYTRRCFEIPITGTLMMAPFTADLSNMFVEDREIVFYRNKADFVKKIQYYLAHPEKGREIGENGRNRVLRDGHGAVDRVRQIIRDMRLIDVKNR